MRQLLTMWALALVFWAGPVPAAETDQSGGAADQTESRFATPKGVDFSVLPTDMASLRELDSEHRNIARRAARNCFSEGGRPPRAGLFNYPCMVRQVDEGLANADQEALTAFHYALPITVRYDARRTEAEWRPQVEKTIAEAGAQD